MCSAQPRRGLQRLGKLCTGHRTACYHAGLDLSLGSAPGTAWPCLGATRLLLAGWLAPGMACWQSHLHMLVDVTPVCASSLSPPHMSTLMAMSLGKQRLCSLFQVHMELDLQPRESSASKHACRYWYATLANGQSSYRSDLRLLTCTGALRLCSDRLR